MWNYFLNLNQWFMKDFSFLSSGCHFVHGSHNRKHSYGDLHLYEGPVVQKMLFKGEALNNKQWMPTDWSQKLTFELKACSGRVLDLRPRGCRFEPHLRHCVVSLSKTLYPLIRNGSTQEDPSRHNWKIADWDLKNQIKKNWAELKLGYKYAIGLQFKIPSQS